MGPFLPWVGSKAKCAPAIISEFPPEFGTYYEPFLGSGSIFFGMDERWSHRTFERARLSDTNENLINCWRAVMDRPTHVKQMLVHCLERNTEEFYIKMKTQMSNPSVFLYVMKAAFSSIYRVNAKGQFNVPWRKLDYVTHGTKISFDVDRLDSCSLYMSQRKCELFVADWMTAIQSAVAGDLVYLDPPYLKYNETGFVNYTRGGFNEGDHVFLRTEARLLSERGVHVFLSNSDVPASRRLYGEPFKIINVPNAIKSTARTKGTRSEGLWRWLPKG
jgi:DNA adenine methylase